MLDSPNSEGKRGVTGDEDLTSPGRGESSTGCRRVEEGPLGGAATKDGFQCTWMRISTEEVVPAGPGTAKVAMFPFDSVSAEVEMVFG